MPVVFRHTVWVCVYAAFIFVYRCFCCICGYKTYGIHNLRFVCYALCLLVWWEFCFFCCKDVWFPCFNKSCATTHLPLQILGWKQWVYPSLPATACRAPNGGCVGCGFLCVFCMCGPQRGSILCKHYKGQKQKMETKKTKRTEQLRPCNHIAQKHDGV